MNVKGLGKIVYRLPGRSCSQNMRCYQPAAENAHALLPNIDITVLDPRRSGELLQTEDHSVGGIVDDIDRPRGRQADEAEKRLVEDGWLIEKMVREGKWQAMLCQYDS